MHRRRSHTITLGSLALVASTLTATDAPMAATATTATTASAGAAPAALTPKATMQVGFTDVTAIGGLAEPVSVAFAGDGTAFIALKTGCPVMDRVSRLTATRTTLGWTMVPNSELPLVTDGCAQFSSHASGDVVFGPDGLLYASAGDGASFRGQDFGQANFRSKGVRYVSGRAHGTRL